MNKYIVAVCVLTSALLARGATFTNSVSVDAFVRASAPTSNYGGAGADAVSGASATNSAGAANGAFDSFIRFNTLSMVTNLNVLYGSNSWAITSATLQVMEQGAPNSSLFNRGKGSFEILWIANDNWTEGTGNPVTPTTTGIVYTNESGLLNSVTDVSLGTYTNAGVDGLLTYSLPLASAFVADMTAGGEVGLFMTAVDANIGFTFSARSVPTSSSRPYLIISAVPKPAIAAASFNGADLVLSCANGAAGSTVRVLASTDIALPIAQWNEVANTVVASDGPFTVTVANALAASTHQYFVLQLK